MLHSGDHSKIQDLTLNGNKTNRIVKHCDRDVVWQLGGEGTLNLVNPIQNPYSFGNVFKNRPLYFFWNLVKFHNPKIVGCV
jgi:hypothetical protein